MTSAPPTVSTCLWISTRPEEAVRFYTDLIPGSELLSLETMSGTPGGDTVIAEFTLARTPYRLIGSPSDFALNQSVSISVTCADQDEVDRYWDALVADGGQPGPCGWLTDRWGLSWQIIPTRLNELLADPDRERAQRALQAMLGMGRLVVADLEAAADAS